MTTMMNYASNYTMEELGDIIGKKMWLRFKDGSLIKSIPVLILKEYPRFYLADVLPHRNFDSFGTSTPYSITINKCDLMVGDVALRR